jgi:cell fate (sporulation/competence/biofilm development) regulator YlbF (YheA/YmcA/DUF963 family)
LEWITAILAAAEAAVDRKLDATLQDRYIPAELLETASVLAANLNASEAFMRFKSAERKLNTDREALSLLSQLSELQQKVRTEQYSGTVTESDLTRLRELQIAVGTNEVIQEYGFAQELAVAFLKEVNQEISQLLNIDFASLSRRSSGCC